MFMHMWKLQRQRHFISFLYSCYAVSFFLSFRVFFFLPLALFLSLFKFPKSDCEVAWKSGCDVCVFSPSLPLFSLSFCCLATACSFTAPDFAFSSLPPDAAAFVSLFQAIDFFLYLGPTLFLLPFSPFSFVLFYFPIHLSVLIFVAVLHLRVKQQLEFLCCRLSRNEIFGLRSSYLSLSCSWTVIFVLISFSLLSSLAVVSVLLLSALPLLSFSLLFLSLFPVIYVSYFSILVSQNLYIFITFTLSPLFSLFFFFFFCFRFTVNYIALFCSFSISFFLLMPTLLWWSCSQLTSYMHIFSSMAEDWTVIIFKRCYIPSRSLLWLPKYTTQCMPLICILIEHKRNNQISKFWFLCLSYLKMNSGKALIN